ncbi:MAG TPA: TRZ/ATZ family hydrolase [Casimicrobiaceae bacterium]|nr:TRZ/ATZ family hydrolase [Casimicrobiaceae bacterium]
MPTVDLRLDARWVLPVAPRGALPLHSVAVDAGRIAAVLPTAVAEREFAARHCVALGTHALLPGLVNAHTHAGMTLLRGIADDLALEPWLEKRIWPLEAAFLSPEFVHDGTLLGAAEMLRGGVTCCNDQYFFPDAAARAYRESGMRAMLGVAVLDFPTAFAADADGYLQAGLAARDAWRNEPLLSFSLAPHAPYTVGDASWRKIVVYARELDLPIQTHLLETHGERAASVAAFGVGPLQRLHHLGVTGPGFIAVHGTHLDHADIALLHEQGCHVVHCPASNLKLASGIAPVAELARRGVNVALGTDGAASNNRLDVFGEARLAALLAKGASGDAAVLPAADVIEMATLNGARALGLERDIGTLEPGKSADLIAVDLGAVEHAPCFDPIAQLIHVTGRDQVTDVWVAGERVVSERRLARVDAGELAARTRFWQERLQSRSE